MLIHKLKPGESLYIRGEIEIKNLSEKKVTLGCIGGGEVSTDVVDAAASHNICRHEWRENDHSVIQWVCAKCGGWSIEKPPGVA